MTAGAARRTQRPVVLALSGLEPTGRAGLLADLEAIRSAGGIPVGIATALTAQGARTFAVGPVPESMLRAQIQAVSELETIAAVKLGMVHQAAALRWVLRTVKTTGFWVIDPVTRTSRGQRLSLLRPGDYLAAAAPNVVLTPNLDEAAWLLRRDVPARTAEGASRMGERLASYGFAAVIVKGGHLAGRAVDVIADKSGVQVQSGARINTGVRRGTGCRFASVLATALARGETLTAAAREAKRRVRSYLLEGSRQNPRAAAVR
ncbi:MAG TPA: bifunctional hydroxymethylpyrimidine kinase/phosphomethylpyrimidine kinase [Myxococcaceae bacterium]|nr:bifunctional hydroxymethylpyrimidine kinase/phosphomethylpyrimidine kinase [Myxococcaceae bacterium]